MLRIKLILFMLLTINLTFSQSIFDSFHYQGYLNDEYKNLFEQTNEATFAIYERDANTNLKIYEENQDILINNKGYFSAYIGEGIVSNGFTSLSELTFSEAKLYYLNIKINGTQIEDVRFMSVPFAMISQKTLQKYYLSSLQDVDTTGIEENNILKWDGDKWIASIDLHSDTISYADTAIYALKADSSLYADTARYAYESKDAWYVYGNTGTDPLLNFIGTKDNTPLHFATNNSKRMTILEDGKIGVGTTNPSTDFHVVGDNGFLFESATANGSIPIEGIGTRMMWYPGKRAFRGGTLDPVRPVSWDDAQIGEYTFAFGKNIRAKGDYSVAFGELSDAQGDYSMAIGYQSATFANADYSFSVGYGCRTFAPYSVSMGRGNNSYGEASSSFNYHTTARGDYSQSFGFYSAANGDNSTAIGRRAFADHDGTFVFADRANSTGVHSTAENQFMARVIGGAIFYTSTDLSTGVTLPSGSGSWSSLSDSTAKTNIFPVDEFDILNKIRKLNVYEWSYKTENGVRHIGPMSQDFYNSFNLGSDKKYISSIDIDGVNLAGVKALYLKTEKLEKTLLNYESLLEKYNKLEKEKEALEERLNQIESRLLNEK